MSLERFNIDLEDYDYKLLKLLVEYLIKHPSSLIDSKKILRSYSVTLSKLEILFSILEKNNIGERVYSYSHEAMDDILTEHYKFYFYDYNLFFGMENGQHRPDQSGALLEQYFYSQVKKLNLFQIYIFRTSKNLEIDFILTSNNLIYCIEIKKDQFIYASDLEALHFFDKAVSFSKKLFVLHNGIRDNMEGKIFIMPLEKWLHSFL